MSMEWLILYVCMYICICVFQCQEQGQLQECVSAVRVCLARLDYVIKVHTTTQPPFPLPTMPPLCLSFFSFPHFLYLCFFFSLCLLIPSFITFSNHFLFASSSVLSSYFLPLFLTSSYPSLLLLSLKMFLPSLSSSLVPHLFFAELVLAQYLASWLTMLL